MLTNGLVQYWGLNEWGYSGFNSQFGCKLLKSWTNLLRLTGLVLGNKELQPSQR